MMELSESEEFRWYNHFSHFSVSHIVRPTTCDAIVSAESVSSRDKNWTPVHIHKSSVNKDIKMFRKLRRSDAHKLTIADDFFE